MNLVICGDFEHFALEISKPEETLVSSIIERVATTLDIPSVEISLYFNNQLLQPASTLFPQCGTQLRSGAGLLVVATPLIITIQRYDTDVSFNVEISRLAAPRWRTNMLFDFCLYKAGMYHRKDGKYVFTVQGIVLQKEKTISNYKFLNHNFTISITFLQTMLVKDPISYCTDTRSVLIPNGCTDDKGLLFSEEQTNCTHPPVKTFIRSGRGRSKQIDDPYGIENKCFGKWRLTIQALDGTKQIVELNDHYLTPVYELRSKVSDGNVRLTFGKTILEDWDEEGRIMLLCSYPQLHHGATLYQINLPDAIRVNCQYSKYSEHLKLHKPFDEVHDERLTIKCPKFICIENPKNFTVERFIRVMENFGHSSSISVKAHDGQQSMTLKELSYPSIPHGTVISSVKCFDNNCLVEFRDYWY